MIRGRRVDDPERTGVIVEVGPGGEPPYRVRFDDGPTAVVSRVPTA